MKYTGKGAARTRILTMRSNSHTHTGRNRLPKRMSMLSLTRRSKNKAVHRKLTTRHAYLPDTVDEAVNGVNDVPLDCDPMHLFTPFHLRHHHVTKYTNCISLGATKMQLRLANFAHPRAQVPSRLSVFVCPQLCNRGGQDTADANSDDAAVKRYRR